MRRILVAGNPNVGKTTLFNSLTKSFEHTGNFHGVTVDAKIKKTKYDNEQLEFVDLPGLYSLNTFSKEEEVAKEILLANDNEILLVVDANSLRKNLYLAQQLAEMGINYKILINNYDFFKKNNKNDCNIKLLGNKLNRSVIKINAKKYKLNKEILKKEEKTTKNTEKINNYLEKYVKIIQNKYNLDRKTIVYALNGVFLDLNKEQINFIKSLNVDLIKDRYLYIDQILEGCIYLNKNFVYGKSRLDKIILNPFFTILGFLLTFFIGFYSIFFLIGPFLSGLEEKVLSFVIVKPVMNILYLTTDNIWLIEFVRNGILSSVLTVISFIPQVALLFIFLSLLEESGVIARLAFVFDDFLNFFGLNGKVFYIMLLGLGCNTMSSVTTKNMNDKNLRIKSLLINPYISCLARLPIFTLIVSTFFGKNSFLIVFGLYVLGLIVALIMSVVLSKTFLKNENNELLLEFPPLKGIDFKHICKVGYVNAKDFFKRVFTVIISVGIIIWILTHTQFNLQYTENVSNSILFFFADKISFIFAPIGLNSSGIVCALIVGVLAKELIVSTMAICNNTQSQKMLSTSLLLTTSVVSFSIPSAISFLVFSLLYSPCVSNLAVIKKEAGKFYMWFSLLSQFTIAYMLSFIVYQALTKGALFVFTISIVIMLIMVALHFIRTMLTNRCNGNCLRCNKKS